MKCLIDGCTNTKDQGEFIGRICRPCYEFYFWGKGIHSQAYRNEQERLKLKEEK